MRAPRWDDDPIMTILVVIFFLGIVGYHFFLAWYVETPRVKAIIDGYKRTCGGEGMPPCR